MKKLLLATAFAAAFLSPAQAGNTIPTDFHGEWCSLNDGTYFVQKSVVQLYRQREIIGDHPCSDDSDGWIKIAANRYDGHEQACKPINITKLRASAITLKLKCTGEGEKFNLTVQLMRTAGSGSGSWIKRLYVDSK